MRWLARRHVGKTYIFAVNDGDGLGEAAFRLSSDPASAEGEASRPWRTGSAKELTGNRALDLKAEGFADRFEPLSVHVYELTRAAE